MTNGIVIFGLVVVAMLILIPVVMVGRIVAAVVQGCVEDRRAEARKITRPVEGLGDFSTYDNQLWFGEVEGIHISVVRVGESPTVEDSQRVRAILQDRPRLIAKAKGYLAAHEDVSALRGGADGFEQYGFDYDTTSRFVLELAHPEDPDGMYRVEFRDGEPVASGRDD